MVTKFDPYGMIFKIKFKYSTFFTEPTAFFLEHTKIAQESHIARGNASQGEKKWTNITLLRPF